ncbi:hypothetical protein CBS101457_004085 [Exobasidium rhododendri]|nr:hypothetical protein CBS101457_004085 [Exobasidium rhododendri]
MGLPPRHSRTVPAPPRRGGPPAINPNLILALRFLITGLVCLLSLACAIMSILVVKYYNDHDPIIRPSWGSLIFIIVLGFFTPIIYFGYNIVLPLAPFINYGDFLYSLFMVKLELLLQFTFCVLWVSGALAYASDLRGYDNCQFDGYFHYPEPADFMHVCDLTNYVVPLNYATFGVQTFLFLFEFVFGMYTFLYLDQESLSESHFSWGRRAYDYRIGANQSGTNGRGNAYRARAINADERSVVSGSDNNSGGRRGAAYNDEERQSDMAESLRSGPASLGARGRGRRGYDDENDAEDANHEAYDGIHREEEEEEDNEGWHLRDEPTTTKDPA